MAKQIKRSEIAEQDLYKEVRDSAKKTITQINSLNKKLKNTAEVLQGELSQPLKTTLEGLTKLDTQITQANTTMSQSIKLDKAKAEALKTQAQAEQQILKVEQERQKVIQQKMNTDKKLRLEKERVLKANQKAVKLLRDETNAYKVLVKATRDQKNESKRLGAEMLKLEASGKKNTREYRVLAKTFKSVTLSAQKGDKALKKLDGTVGDNFRNVGNYSKAVGKLRGALGSLGLAFGGAMILRNVFNTVKDFDQAQANLQSVLGVTRDKMSALTEQSKQLGATTRFTASEVSGLQLEYAKLGFDSKDIEGMTSATLDLAGATGTDLGETATIVGSTLRSFGLDVSETRRVTDVMSKSFTKSSLDMSKFATAMSSVGPVAKISGKTIEETTALLGTLTDRGIDASTAGTGLRNMFLKSNRAGLTLDEALLKINESTDQIGTSFELFGTRGATLGVVLANNKNDVDNLTEALDKAKGSTKDMADVQMKTLAGSIALVRSAWEGFILQLNDSGGVGEKLRKSLRFIADNFQIITKVMGKLVQSFIAYKVAMVSLKLINLATSTSFKDMGSAIMRNIPLTKAYKNEQIALATASKTSATAVKGFGSALAGIGIGIAIGLAFELAKAFYDVASGNAEARRQLDLYRASVKDGKTEGEGVANEENKRLKDRLTLINQESRILKSKETDKKKISELELDRLKKLTEAQEKSTNSLRISRKLNQTEINELTKSLRDFESLPETKTSISKGGGREVSENMTRTKGIDRVSGLITAKLEANKVIDETLKTMNGALVEFQIQGLEAEKEYGIIVEDNTGKGRVRNTVFKRSIDLLKEKNALLQNNLKIESDLQKVTNQIKIKDIDKEIKAEGKIQKENISLGIETDPTKLKDLIKKRETLIVNGIEKTNAYIKGIETQKLEDRFIVERKKITDQHKKLLLQADIKASEIAKIEANLKVELDIIDDAEIIAKESLNNTILGMDAQKNIKIVEEAKKTNESLAVIDDNRKAVIDGVHTREQKEFKLSLLKSKKTNEDIAKAMLKFDIEQLKKKIENYKKAGEETLDLEIKLQELLNTNDGKDVGSVVDSDKKRTEDQIAVLTNLTDIYTTLADKRIAKIDEEIAKSKERFSSFQELAKNGNILAKESMAEESKNIADQNRLKEKEERRKQRVQLASSVLQTYLANSSDPNVKNPLVKTITDTVLLTQFIKSLPAFAEGTEDTGSNGLGVDGKGGFNAILHPNERVITKNQNKLIGAMSNEDLSKLANDYQNGLITDFGSGAVQIGNAWQTDVIVKKLDSLESTIRNKPETNIELEEIIGGAMTISRKTKTGNTKVYNRYRVN